MWTIIFVCTENHGVDYAVNISRHRTKFSRPGNQAPGFLHPWCSLWMKIVYVSLISNLCITDWVQNVPRLVIFFNTSRWYRVTELINLFVCSLKSPWHKIIIMQWVYGVLVWFFFSQIRLVHFAPVLILFVRKPSPEKQDCKCCQFSACVCKDLGMNTIHITYSSCKELS